MESESAKDVSSAEAVLLGALAPGVNGPTWITLKFTFLMMGLSLAVMLGLAFSSSDSPLMLHVTFLVLICLTLFFLLSWGIRYSIAKHPGRSMKLMPELNHQSETQLASYNHHESASEPQTCHITWLMVIVG